MLELSPEQLASLADIDAINYVARIRSDLVSADAGLSADATLSARLWSAFRAARDYGITTDENTSAFLRIEAYSPGFYSKPATRAWLTRPGATADSRFHDYLRVLRWRIQHPEFKGGALDGEFGGDGNRGGGNRIGAALGSRWRSLVGWGRGRGNGKPVG
jgi:hypothetical protein